MCHHHHCLCHMGSSSSNIYLMYFNMQSIANKAVDLCGLGSWTSAKLRLI